MKPRMTPYPPSTTKGIAPPSMRPGHEAPDDAGERGAAGGLRGPSMRPGQEAPDDALAPGTARPATPAFNEAGA